MNVVDTLGLEKEGIFRQSGSHALVEYMRDLYDTGASLHVLALPPEYAYSVAALLKLYLRALPEPLLTHNLYPAFIKASLLADKNERVAEILRLCNEELPDEQAVVLRCLLGFLRRVCTFASMNLMTRQNVALMFGPNLMRMPPQEDSRASPDAVALAQLRDTALVNDVAMTLIEHAQELHPRASTPVRVPKQLPTPPSKPKAAPPTLGKHVDSEVKMLLLALQQQLAQEREERLQREARMLAVLREEREARLLLEAKVRDLCNRFGGSM